MLTLVFIWLVFLCLVFIYFCLCCSLKCRKARYGLLNRTLTSFFDTTHYPILKILFYWNHKNLLNEIKTIYENLTCYEKLMIFFLSFQEIIRKCHHQVHLFYKQLVSGLSPKSWLYFQGCRYSKLLNGCLVVSTSDLYMREMQ